MGLGQILQAFGKAAVSGIPGTEQRYRADAAEQKATQDEMAWGNHLQEIGAKPIFNGLVREDVTAPDGSVAPIYRQPSPERIRTRQKTRGGNIEWEVPSPEEQATRRIEAGLKQLHQQFAGETDIRRTAGEEKARDAGLEAGARASATGNAQMDVLNQERERSGIEVPSELDQIFAGISTIPGSETPASREQITPGIALETNAAGPKKRKLLPAEFDPLVRTAATVDNLNTQVDARKSSSAIQQLSGVTDQAGYDAVRTANPEASARWPKLYSKPIVASLIRQNVPVEKQPDYDIKALTAGAMDSMTHDPAQIDAQIDAVIPAAGETSKLNVRTKALVRSAIARGDLKAAQEYIKDGSDQIGRTETAVATARATAPIKIQVAGANAAAQSAAAGLTEDDFRRAGAEYAITGVMPQLGNGSGGIKAKILHYKNEFARDSGLTPRDMVLASSALKGDVKSLSALQSQRDQIGAFEKTARANLQLFLEAAAKIPDTGVPWLNSPIRELSDKIVGSTNMAAVNAARAVATNEIAKVTAGGGLSGVLSDTARKEVKDYNPANATFAQTKAVAQILVQDMENRMANLDGTLEEIKKRIGTTVGGGTVKMTSPDGRETFDVPANQVEHYKGKGAKLVAQ